MKRTTIILLDCLILAGVMPGCGTAFMGLVEAIEPEAGEKRVAGPGFVEVVDSISERNIDEHPVSISPPAPAKAGAIGKAAVQPQAAEQPQPEAPPPAGIQDAHGTGPAAMPKVPALDWEKPILPTVKATSQPVERSVASPGSELDSAVQGLVAKLGNVKILKTTIHNESGDPARLVALYAASHREALVIDPIDAEGRVSPKALALFEDLMRSSRTDDAHAVDPMLVRLLHAVALAHDGVLVITSGYREPGHGTKPTSTHTKGMAADVHHPYLPAKAIVDFAREWGADGIGYYPRSGFVHLDVRDEPYYWVDTSGKGQKGHAVADMNGLLSDYAASKYEGLETGLLDGPVSEIIEEEPEPVAEPEPAEQGDPDNPEPVEGEPVEGT